MIDFFRLNLFDKMITLIAFGCFLISFFLIIDDSYLFQNIARKSSSNILVASLLRVENDVRKKMENDLVWYPAKNKGPVMESEMIYTGNESNATILFNDGGEFSLESDSLVVVRRQADVSNIIIRRGGFSGVLGERMSVSIHGKGQSHKIIGKNTMVNITVEKDKAAQINIVSGKAKIISVEKGISRNIEKNQAIKIDKKGVETKIIFDIMQTSPVSSAVIWMRGKKNVTFQWDKSGRRGGVYFLEIAKERRFKHILRSLKTDKLQLTLEFPPEQTIYWRVRYVLAGSKHSSMVRRLNLRMDKAPYPFLPGGSTTLSYPVDMGGEDERFSVLFKWKDKTGGRKYRLQVSKGKEFENLIFNKTIPEIFSEIRLAEGFWFWRVQIVDKNRSDELWSQIRSFKVIAKLDPPPILITPANKSQIEVPFDENKLKHRVKFSWDSEKRVSQYHIQISNDETFKRIIFDENIDKMARSKTLLLSEGIWFWRARIGGRQKFKRVWSETGGFTLKMKPFASPPVLTSPEDFKIYEIFGKKEVVIPVNWDDKDRVGRYEIVIARNKNFQKDSIVLREEINGEHYMWKSDKSGLYFCRVRGKINTKKITEFSKSGQINIIRLEHLRMISDLSGKIWVNGGEIFKFEWKKSTKVKNYSLQFSEDVSFEKIRMKFLTSDSKLKLKAKKLPVDKELFWRLRGMDEKNKVVASTSPQPVFLKLNKIVVLKHLGDNGHLNFPPLLDDIKHAKKKYDVHFEWNDSTVASKYKIQVGINSNFKRLKYDQIVKVSSIKFALMKGKYYWRIKIADKNRPNSRWSKKGSIVISANYLAGKPLLLAPAEDEKREASFRTTIEFKWKKHNLASKYEIQLGRKLKFEGDDKIVTALMATNRYLWKPGKTGVIYWRTRAISAKNEITDYSKTRKLFVQRVNNLVSPTLKNEKVSIEVTKVRDTEIVLEWSKVDDAERYLIEISRSKKFKKFLITEKIDSRKFEWKGYKLGKFFWRVKSLDQFDGISRTKTIGRILITVKPPASTSDEKFYVETIKGRNNPVRLKWSARSFAKQYMLEYGESSKFKYSKIVVVKTPYVNIVVPTGKMIFWRVQALDNDELPVSKMSQTYNFNTVQD